MRATRKPLPLSCVRLTMRRCVHRGLDLTQRLVQAGQGGGSTTFPWSVNDNLLEKKAWVAGFVRHRSGKSPHAASCLHAHDAAEALTC